jgi:hypothetical protein
MTEAGLFDGGPNDDRNEIKQRLLSQIYGE